MLFLGVFMPRVCAWCNGTLRNELDPLVAMADANSVRFDCCSILTKTVKCVSIEIILHSYQICRTYAVAETVLSINIRISAQPSRHAACLVQAIWKTCKIISKVFYRMHLVAGNVWRDIRNGAKYLLSGATCSIDRVVSILWKLYALTHSLIVIIHAYVHIHAQKQRSITHESRKLDRLAMLHVLQFLYTLLGFILLVQLRVCRLRYAMPRTGHILWQQFYRKQLICSLDFKPQGHSGSNIIIIGFRLTMAWNWFFAQSTQPKYTQYTHFRLIFFSPCPCPCAC